MLRSVSFRSPGPMRRMLSEYIRTYTYVRKTGTGRMYNGNTLVIYSGMPLAGANKARQNLTIGNLKNKPKMF